MGLRLGLQQKASGNGISQDPMGQQEVTLANRDQFWAGNEEAQIGFIKS